MLRRLCQTRWGNVYALYECSQIIYVFVVGDFFSCTHSFKVALVTQVFRGPTLWKPLAFSIKSFIFNKPNPKSWLTKNPAPFFIHVPGGLCCRGATWLLHASKCWTSRHVNLGLQCNHWSNIVLVCLCDITNCERKIYLASSANAIAPATIGADADVPICSDVHLPPTSVATYNI